MSNQKHNRTQHMFDDGTTQEPMPSWAIVVLVILMLIAGVVQW